MIGVTAFFYGISCIGAVRASVIMNLEPIGSIALGFIVLGQILSPSQLIGATCVIVSLIGIKTLDGDRKVGRLLTAIKKLAFITKILRAWRIWVGRNIPT